MADDDEIYIDVVPRLDERAADEVEGKLKGKLSHVGDSLKDSISGAFDNIGGPLDRLKDKLGDSLKDSIGGALSDKEWTKLSHRTATAVGGGLVDAIGDLTKGADLGKALGDNLRPALNSVSADLEKILGKLPDSVKKAGDVLSGNSDNPLGDAIDSAKGFGFNVPGPLGGLSHANDVLNSMNQHPGQVEDRLSHIPGMGVMENVFEKGPQKVGETIHDWFTGKPQSPARDSASDKWSSSVAGAISLEANTATISAGSVTLGGNMSFPGLPTGNSLAGSGGGGRTTSTGIAAAGGDSGSMASLYSGGGGTTIGKGHYASGGVLPGGSPGHDNMIGMLPSGSMVGLEGGEGVIRPEAMRYRGVADLVASLNQHYDVGTTNVGGDPNNPPLSTPPTQPNQGGSGPIQQQQLGKGQGGGVSGGGLIGAAEQAGVMAATVGGFGAGGVAAQMAVQETNLAVQKTSQMAAALATAPFETLGLSGGMMGAPQVNPMGGWAGKLVSGQLGSQDVLANLAGSVQPPKQPQDKGEHPQQDPGNGGQPTGPTGAKDDPMHVNVTNQPQQPQGGATSAGNMTGVMSAGTA